MYTSTLSILGTLEIQFEISKLKIKFCLFLVAPKFSSPPTAPDLVKEGDSLSIPCSTSEGNPTPVVSWMKGEVNISSGWGRADLNFTSIKKKDNGSYKCVAVNMKTKIQSLIELDIKCKFLPNVLFYFLFVSHNSLQK